MLRSVIHRYELMARLIKLLPPYSFQGSASAAMMPQEAVCIAVIHHNFPRLIRASRVLNFYTAWTWRFFPNNAVCKYSYEGFPSSSPNVAF
jgi:hypothetical protein